MDYQTTEKPSANFLIPGAIVVAGLIIAGAVIYTNQGKKSTASLKEAVPQNQNEQPENQQPQNQQPSGNQGVADISVEGEPVLGNAQAPVTMIEFSDFQCPYCGVFDLNIFSQIKKEYVDTGKVKVVFKNFPLSFHQFAETAAEAGECANEQGKFWELSEKMFSNQDNLSVDDLKKYAQELGLDTQKFNSCLDSGKYKDEVQKDFQEAIAAGIQGTPSFLIGSQSIVGAQPFSEFQKVIDAELK